MRIVLLGYMGCGKSIIAKELANKLNVMHIDLDDYIEQKESKKISYIFKNSGEIKFRLLENQYLLDILNSKKQFILSVGGGTPCYANNMDLILKHSNSYFLKASVETLYERLVSKKAERPLIKLISKEKLKEFIAKHLFERNNYYNIADRIVVVDLKSIEEITKEIIKSI